LSDNNDRNRLLTQLLVVTSRY